MRLIKGMALVFAGLMLVSCGGGKGGGGSDDGTTDPEVPVAADLSLTLAATSLENSGSRTMAVSVVAVDKSRVALPDVAVQMQVDSGAVIAMDETVTGDSGEVTGTVSIGPDHSNRVITVTAKSGSVTRTATFQVTGAKLQATFDPIVVPGKTARITYRLTDVNSNAMTGQAISVSAPGLATKSGTTNANGEYVFSYTAPTDTGNLRITAEAGGDENEHVVLVQSDSSSIPNVAAGSVRSATLSANPSVVPVNDDTTNNQATVRALFLGVDNSPIKNVRARFNLNGDPNSIGGKFAAGSAVVYSDANGQSITAYVPGSRSSPTDGVEIRVCWDYRDFSTSACPNEVVTTLTVVSEPLSVAIGKNNLLEEGVDNLTYIQKFIVQVVDASGLAKSGVLITPSLDLPQYRKGTFRFVDAWVGRITATCFNEDINRNGVIEDEENDGLITIAPNGDRVADNANGSLEPRKAAVGVSVVGSNRTDAKGQVELQIEYAKSNAAWIQYRLLATAGVSGSEGRDSMTDWLGFLSADAGEQTVEPPFIDSPYGQATSCADPK